MSAKCEYCGLIYPVISDLKKHYDICCEKMDMDAKLENNKEESI